MNLDTLTSPYQWPALGPWLRRPAQERGHRRAYRLYHLDGIPPEQVLCHAHRDIRRAAALGSESWLYESIGLALEIATLRENEP